MVDNVMASAGMPYDMNESNERNIRLLRDHLRSLAKE